MKETFNFHDLPEVGNRYITEECLGEGVCGKVYKAKDTQVENKKVAIKIQRFIPENECFIQEEYRVLRDFSNHPNLPEFYGIYKNTNEDKEEIWFIMELCEGGPVIDLVKGLLAKNRRMAEEHIALVLKEVVKAVIYLHENKVLHRDIRASNILLTKEGEVKLVDFGLSNLLKSTLGKTASYLGSPSWMAPEVISTQEDGENTEGYDNRADVWSLGITAIELADGESPFQDMHPTRAIFQIVRNPPPTLLRPANWSENFIDFINECLVKNPEYRPYMMELIDHPFLTEIRQNYYYLNLELKVLCEQYSNIGKEGRIPEAIINSNLLKKGEDGKLEQMQVEDLATLSELTEESVLQELSNRLGLGQFCTYIGDVLLVLNPNEQQDIYGEEQHALYRFKSRSDNAPHIYSVADSAYQAVLHHQNTQHILLAGESSSGKTSNYLHMVDHLLYLGQNTNINQDRIKNAIKLLHALTHASTPTNNYSTRCVIHTEIIFGKTGKNTGARFEIYQLEKWRVSSTDMDQSNFHILYYFYDGIQETGELNKYLLNNDREYRYLRILQDSNSDRPRDNPKQNARKYQKILEIFKEYEFDDEQIESILCTLAAIINLGELRFCQKADAEEVAEIENEDTAFKVAQLLKIDEKKFIWALTNYCVVNDETATRKRHNCEEARDARDVLANTLYSRVVQYVVMVINKKLSYGTAIFGNKYSIKLLDFYGFECFKQNHLPQFLINCTNELLHYHYLQRIFGWEALETNEEDIPYKPIYYYNNKEALDEMLGKSGLLNLIDTASKMARGGKYVVERLRTPERIYINKINGLEFCVNHYTGKVTYDSKEMPDRNRNFLPPEIIDTLRQSNDSIIKSFFTSKLSKAGNLCGLFEDDASADPEKYQFSQTKRMRTVAATFKAFSIELLKELSVGGGAGGTHFVRCIRSDLQNNPRGFHKEIVKQQLRAMSILDTAKARQQGFPHRIPFPEFLRRYKFLAFDFDENVEVTKENCRLLLVRLKMEGWVIGKTKVFLKYYNEEYLSRLYETQVKKVIKIQSIIRTYLARRKMIKKLKLQQKVKKSNNTEEQKLTEDEAATVVQKAYRKYMTRKIKGTLSKDKFDGELIEFIRHFFNKWKSRTIFQVLLQYRAARFQDFYNLSQQVHLYNQNVMNILLQNSNVDLECVDSKAQMETWLGDKKPSVLKLPFRLDEVPYFDTTYMCEPLTETIPAIEIDEESWDSPFKWRETIACQITTSILLDNEKKLNKFQQNQLIELPYTRNPLEIIRCLASPTIDSEDEKLDEISTSYKDASEARDVIDNLSRNTTIATKDFEYIKPPPSEKIQKNKSEFVNPIVELEIKGRKETNLSDDDPPFNFQAMLRKTNFQRNSIKREKEVSRQLSFQNKKLKSVKDQEDDVEKEKTVDMQKNNVRKLSAAENKSKQKDAGEPTAKDAVVSDIESRMNSIEAQKETQEAMEKKTENENEIKEEDEGKVISPKRQKEDSVIMKVQTKEEEQTNEDNSKQIIEESYEGKKDEGTEKHKTVEFVEEIFTLTEIAPGIFLEGIIVDL